MSADNQDAATRGQAGEEGAYRGANISSVLSSHFNNGVQAGGIYGDVYLINHAESRMRENIITTETTPSIESEFTQALNEFKKGLTNEECRRFGSATFESIQEAMAALQEKQAESKRLQFMRRLDPFFKTMTEYAKVVEVFLNGSKVLAFVWGPMKFVLMLASTLSEAFCSLLDAYEYIGEKIPLLSSYQALFRDNAHMRSLLLLIFKELLSFHGEGTKYFKNKLWRQLFQVTWTGFTSKIERVKTNIESYGRLIVSHASLEKFEQIQATRRLEENKLQKLRADDIAQRREAVLNWLSPAKLGRIHEHQVNAREGNSNAGRWLIEDQRFKNWFDEKFCSTPLLWLHGKPGAGKTVLASVVIDEAERIRAKIPDISIGYFYCAESDPERNTFIAVLRCLLAQLVIQSKDNNLTLLLHEAMSRSEDGTGVLSANSSVGPLKDLLKIVLYSRKTYIIIDGIDECSREHRKEICAWFREVVDSLPRKQMDEIRCLFISQNDGIARKDLSMHPEIAITTENIQDIESFAKISKEELEENFGKLSDDIVKIVTAKSQGIFVYAKCVLKEMSLQPTRHDLLEEWNAETLPKDLDSLYQRILDRILGNRGSAGNSKKQQATRQLLAWICCAKRPMRWHEIQGGWSLNLDVDGLNISHDDRRLKDDLRDFCASLVEVHDDQTVHLVHPTVKDIQYLGSPPIDLGLAVVDIKSATLAGSYAFYDYAIAAWVPHLLSWLPHISPGDAQALSDDLEGFFNHYRKPENAPTISKTMHTKLEGLGELDCYETLAESVVWIRKLLAGNKTEPKDDVLDFLTFTNKLRSSLEDLAQSSLSPEDKKRLEKYYGTELFKCPKIYCPHFYHGFVEETERRLHVERHERIYTCTLEACPSATFGFVSKSALNKHLLECHGVLQGGGGSKFPRINNPDEEETDKRKKEPEEPLNHQCKQCPKRFTRPHNLRAHVRTHTNERPFACTVCSKAFARQNDRKRHERLHGNKSYVCNGNLIGDRPWGCGKKYSRADDLNAHFKSQAGRICLKPLEEEYLTLETPLVSQGKYLSSKIEDVMARGRRSQDNDSQVNDPQANDPQTNDSQATDSQLTLRPITQATDSQPRADIWEPLPGIRSFLF